MTALLNKKIDLFFTSGDSTVMLALETVAGILTQYKIPYFTNSPSDVERGAFFSIGADYYEVGVETAKMVQRVIEGENPKDIPIKEFVPERIGINLSLAKLYGITIPESILRKAAREMIRLEHLHKKFNPGTTNEVYPLRDLSLEIKEGEFITVIGTNGSGKSTLLNVIAGTFLPDSGKIFLVGNDVTQRKDFERAKYISRVFQNPFMGTAPEMTLAENLLMAILRGEKHYPKIGLNGKRLSYFRSELANLEMGLEDRLDTLMGTLSGGQRQAVTLLMAVIKEPKVLLLDEHTAALDPKSAAQVIQLTRTFIEEKTLTTLMVTHSMQQALDLGSRTVMMHRGEMIDDISEKEKRRLTVNDLLEKFAELRKSEKLTEEMIEQLRREYL